MPVIRAGVRSAAPDRQAPGVRPAAFRPADDADDRGPRLVRHRGHEHPAGLQRGADLRAVPDADLHHLRLPQERVRAADRVRQPGRAGGGRRAAGGVHAPRELHRDRPDGPAARQGRVRHRKCGLCHPGDERHDEHPAARRMPDAHATRPGPAAGGGAPVPHARAGRGALHVPRPRLRADRGLGARPAGRHGRRRGAKRVLPVALAGRDAAPAWRRSGA